MLKPYDLLDRALLDIEQGIRNNIDAVTLADRYYLSERHLRRLFKFAFKVPVSKYIRSRRLAVSLDDLLKTDINILDIALNFGFNYEQSYINAFKTEFGMTPGDVRKSRQIVKVRPPLHLFDENKMKDGLVFGPDIVMVPQFRITGNPRRIPLNEPVTTAQRVAIEFWNNERYLISDMVNPNVYIGLTNRNTGEKGISEYIPSVQVRDFKNTPEGYATFTFNASLCARFRYIGKHHYFELNRDTAKAMYNAILRFNQNEHSGYALLRDRIYFERIDTTQYDGTYCQMEWFSPVTEKTGNVRKK